MRRGGGHCVCACLYVCAHSHGDDVRESFGQRVFDLQLRVGAYEPWHGSHALSKRPVANAPPQQIESNRDAH